MVPFLSTLFSSGKRKLAAVAAAFAFMVSAVVLAAPAQAYTYTYFWTSYTTCYYAGATDWTNIRFYVAVRDDGARKPYGFEISPSNDEYIKRINLWDKRGSTEYYAGLAGYPINNTTYYKTGITTTTWLGANGQPRYARAQLERDAIDAFAYCAVEKSIG
jgi:hypothetical protein